MTKRRYLRKGIQTTLEIITVILIVLLGSLDDFELSAIPMLMLMMTTLITNVIVLNKYGKY